MITRVQRLFLGKTQSVGVQFVRYLFVGGAAAAADTATLYFLNTRLGMNHLTAAALGFIVGLLINYLISIAWVFESKGNYKQELILFSIIGLGGLVLTELIMWVTVSLAGMPVLGGKVIAMALVLLWNFGLRRKLVFEAAAPQPPARAVRDTA